MLTDFGLAKDVTSESKMTHSGVTLGTPSYMPPEQAEGNLNQVDPRSDIYSLGATLYEMLTLQPPFEGSTIVEVIHKVLLQDPLSPKRMNPSVDRDLDTICLKCLEKEPQRRYSNAGVLARDLANYLEGEPITARPPSLTYRLVRKIRRHRGVALTALIALVLLSAGGIVGAYLLAKTRGKTEREADRATAAERLLEKNRKVAKVLLDAHVRLGREHADLKAIFYDETKTQEEKQAAYAKHEGKVEAFFRPILEGDRAPEAPVAMALTLKGWFLRLGGDLEQAARLFEQAKEVDPTVGWGRLFEAMLWISQYFHAMELPDYEVGPAGVEIGPIPAETEGMRKSRERFSALLEETESTEVWGVELSEAFKDALEKIRNIGGDPAAAEAGVSGLLALSEFVWVEEELRIARSDLRSMQGDFEGAKEDMKAFLKRCPDSGTAWARLGKIKAKGATGIQAQGGDVRDLLREAIRDYDEALKRMPGHPVPLNGRGVVRLSLGKALASKGEDPREVYGSAIEDFTAAIRADPMSVLYLSNRGNAFRDLGRAHTERGEDPQENFLRAIRDYEKVLRLDPEDASAYGGRGSVYNAMADEQSGRGEDAGENLHRAIRDFDAALKKFPDRELYCANRAGAYLKLGEREIAMGGDPRVFFRRAIEDYNRTVHRNPKYAEGYNGRAAVYLRMGQVRSRRGEDPREVLTKAIEDLGEALQRNPEDDKIYSNRGFAYRMVGEAEERRGMDPRPTFEKALAEFDKALARNPECGTSFLGRGNVYMLLGAVEAQQGGDPFARYRRGIADFEEALRKNPADANIHHSLGIAYGQMGEAQAARKMDARKSYRKSIEAFGEGLRRNPAVAAMYSERGKILLRLGIAEEQAGADSREFFRRAVEDQKTTLIRDPKFPGVYFHLGNAYQHLGETEIERRENPLPAYDEALKAYENAVARNPRLWRAHLNRGLVLANTRRFEEAIRDWESAREIVGDRYPPLQRWISRARAELARPKWISTLITAGWRIRWGDWGNAAALFAEGFAEAEKVGASLEVGSPNAEFLRISFFNYARCLSRLSEGLKSRKAEPEAVPEEQRKRLQSRAIESLRKSLTLGWKDLDRLRSDPDLSSLRERPEFQALLGEGGKK
jgi:serine/threonine-protein kinase